MNACMNVWNSEMAKEIFLCIVESPKTQKQIVSEIGYKQNHVSKIKDLLKDEKLIIEGKEIRKARRPEIQWKLDPAGVFLIFHKAVFPKNPFFSKYNKKPELKTIFPLMESYLKIICSIPLYHCDKWIEKHYKGKKARDWIKYKKQRTNYDKFRLKNLPEGFVEYLLKNRDYLNQKQKEEMLYLIDWFHLSLDSDYLIDDKLIKGVKNHKGGMIK